MPLETSVERNGELVKMWGGNNSLNAFLTVAMIEGCPKFQYGNAPEDTVDTLGTCEIEGVTYERAFDFGMAYVYGLQIPCPLFEEGAQVLNADHIFFSADWEGNTKPIEFKKGDKLKMWRSWK